MIGSLCIRHCVVNRNHAEAPLPGKAIQLGSATIATTPTLASPNYARAAAVMIVSVYIVSSYVLHIVFPVSCLSCILWFSCHVYTLSSRVSNVAVPPLLFSKTFYLIASHIAPELILSHVEHFSPWG
jgi:hypothetical protein